MRDSRPQHKMAADRFYPDLMQIVLPMLAATHALPSRGWGSAHTLWTKAARVTTPSRPATMACPYRPYSDLDLTCFLTSDAAVCHMTDVLSTDIQTRLSRQDREMCVGVSQTLLTSFGHLLSGRSPPTVSLRVIENEHQNTAEHHQISRTYVLLRHERS